MTGMANCVARYISPIYRVNTGIYKVSLLCSALYYARCPYCVVLYMQRVLIINALYAKYNKYVRLVVLYMRSVLSPIMSA